MSEAVEEKEGQEEEGKKMSKLRKKSISSSN